MALTFGGETAGTKTPNFVLKNSGRRLACLFSCSLGEAQVRAPGRVDVWRNVSWPLLVSPHPPPPEAGVLPPFGPSPDKQLPLSTFRLFFPSFSPRKPLEWGGGGVPPHFHLCACFFLHRCIFVFGLQKQKNTAKFQPSIDVP